MIDVVAFGEVMLRLSAGGGATLADAPALDVHVAGSEANVAVALAALGRRTAWVGAVPDDALGRRVTARLRGTGVDVTGVRVVAGARLGTFFVELGLDPRPTRVVYDRAGSAFAGLRTAPLPVEPARWGVVSGVTAAVLRAAPEVVPAFVAHVREHGGRVLVDVNHRALLWSAQEAREGLRALLADADLVVCSERDLVAVLGLPADAAGAARLLTDTAPRADALVVTRGALGASAFSRVGAELHVDAVAITTTADALGAGDAFVAGLLHGLLDDDLAGGLRAGAILGAVAHTVRGDHVLLSAAELDALLAGESGVLR